MKIQKGAQHSDLPRSSRGSAARSGTIDEQRLVSQAKSGCPHSFGELYKRHRLPTYRAVFRILRNRQDAEDAVQRTFQRAFTNLVRFRQGSTFRTWVTRIAINDALMLLRQRRSLTPLSQCHENDLVVSAIDPPDEHLTPEQLVTANELHVALLQAISGLRESLRSVVILKELQGLTSAETAQRLDLTVTAVKARLFHARRSLRKHLERRYKHVCVFNSTL
jgi:RNA polymerase sigma-70 factor (ECF subfamily)